MTVIALLLAIQISPWWYPTRDGSLYLSMARSLATSGSMTGLGDSCPVALPGYPALLSPVFLLGDRPFLLLSVLQWLMAVACMMGVYVWARRQFPSVAVLVTGLAMLNTALWIHYRRTLKEIAFMTVMIWAVNVLHPLAKKLSIRRTVALVIAAALLSSLLVAIRYTGIVLVVGFGAVLLWRVCRRELETWRAVVLILAVSVPASATALGYLQQQRQTIQASGAGTYEDGFRQALSGPESQYLEGLRLRISSVGRITIPGMFKVYARRGDWLNPANALYLLWLIPVTLGWWYLARRKLDVLALSLPLYFGLYIIWPFDQGGRFLVPMVPLLMGCVYAGLCRLPVRRLQRRPSREADSIPTRSASEDTGCRPRLRFGLVPVAPVEGTSVLALLLAAHFVVALGYWMAIDAPRAWAAHQQWPPVDKLVETIQSRPGPVAMPESAEEAQILLQLALDRPIRDYRPDRPIAADVRWVVVPKNIPVEDGFFLHQTVSGYRLYCRQPDQQLASSSLQSR